MNNRAFGRLAVSALCALAAAGCTEDPKIGVMDPGPIPPVNRVPDDTFNARIVQPNGLTSAVTGEPLRFEAVFSFRESPVTPEVIEWRSSLKGTLGSSNPLELPSLTPGAHIISVDAVFEGRLASASFELRVGEIALRILSPHDGSVFFSDDRIDFEALAGTFVDGVHVELVPENPGPNEAQADFRWSSDPAALNSEELEFDRELEAGSYEVVL
ncbi:MAG: hypothetical protein AAFY60_14785, partial [Myxococcota bacterium]